MRNFLVRFLAALVLTGWIFPQHSVSDDDALSIVHVADRDHIVAISSTPDGPRYAVRTISGALLSENLTDQELFAAYPQLHRRISSGYANDASGNFVWAGRDERLIESTVDSTLESE
jgi:hypothetical protein